MTIDDRLSALFEEDQVERVDALGELYEIRHSRGAFGDELLLVRFYEDDHDPNELHESDITELEDRFYDNNTTNQWNIRLIWAYEEGEAPDQEIRSKLENDTRFAIRRCVPQKSLSDFVAPLQTSQEKLANTTQRFDRSELIDNINSQNIGFLFEDLTRDEKFERIKGGLSADEKPDEVSPPTTATEPTAQFIDSVHLGEKFRPNSNLKELDVEPFTLLYGRNGTGKTSLLDGTAFGLVGQIRHEDGRADQYDGLRVKLENDSEPLSTHSKPVNDRVASWFGFRPHGPADKHIEFYRVNYHEAGAATRFIENDPDIDIEETLRRLLFGEELEDVRKDKDKLHDRLEREISTKQTELEELEEEAQSLRDKQERVNEVFSKFELASENLSPAARSVLKLTADANKQGTESSEDTILPEHWATWRERFGTLKDGLDATRVSDTSPDSVGDLRTKFRGARDQVEDILNNIEQTKEFQTQYSQLGKLKSRYNSPEGNQVPASVGLVELIVLSHGIRSEKIKELQQTLDQQTGFEKEPLDSNSIGEWRDAAADAITQELSDLIEQKENIEELDQLDERRRNLQSQIRQQTEEYLSITDELYHCPACYKEQSRDEILEREKPEKIHGDEAKTVPKTLQNRIAELENAEDILESSEWEDIDYEVSIKYADLCGMAAFQQLWDSSGEPATGISTTWDPSSEAVEILSSALKNHVEIDPGDITVEEAMESGIQELEASMRELTANISEIDDNYAEILDVKEEYQERIDGLSAALQILDEFWPESVFHQRLDVESDHRVMKRAIEKIEENPEALEVPGHYENRVEAIEEEIDDIQEVVTNCRDGVRRLETAFETSVEGKLKTFVADHMGVISTLFKAFQLPYEFEKVRYKDEDIVVQRRNEEGVASISAMSSGQRAALALAIFVTNNIAHDRAPPLMMLDEPFAHLDDINTISFFDVLIELARTKERQIMFATASQEIAELLQRKVGESPHFSRVDIPATKLEIDAE